jgi:ketosteroid isomerase-like protein
MSPEQANLETARKYLQAIEAGATGDALARFFTPDVQQHELPNRMAPAGVRRDLAAILASAAHGQQVVAAQRLAVQHAIASGTTVALEVHWTATLAAAVGPIPAGGELQAHTAVFLEFRDGKIAVQRNYDCFEPS